MVKNTCVYSLFAVAITILALIPQSSAEVTDNTRLWKSTNKHGHTDGTPLKLFRDLYKELNKVSLKRVIPKSRLRMCPPGGSSFTMAWSMACTMRRKRDVQQKQLSPKRALIAPSIRQLQTICCDVGCSVNDLLSYCGPLSGW